jgi:hypothetical protein
MERIVSSCKLEAKGESKVVSREAAKSQRESKQRALLAAMKIYQGLIVQKLKTSG